MLSHCWKRHRRWFGALLESNWIRTVPHRYSAVSPSAHRQSRLRYHVCNWVLGGAAGRQGRVARVLSARCTERLEWDSPHWRLQIALRVSIAPEVVPSAGEDQSRGQERFRWGHLRRERGDNYQARRYWMDQDLPVTDWLCWSGLAAVLVHR